MVYTPSFDSLPTGFRWFTHRAFQNREVGQWVIGHYPQRNTIFNSIINTPKNEI